MNNADLQLIDRVYEAIDLLEKLVVDQSVLRNQADDLRHDLRDAVERYVEEGDRVLSGSDDEL